MSAIERQEKVNAPREQKRVLACVACQTRKVKCDRVFPCSNCVRLDLQCEQAKLQQPRPRRRRFPERALLDRIRHYETLLRDHGVPFTPLHPNEAPSDDARPSQEPIDESDSQGESGDLATAWSRRYCPQPEDAPREGMFPLERMKGGTLMHPPQVQIFKFWQIYLERVNPLLKVTHTPSLQPRIIDAASDVTKVTPSLEALLFSIYCVAVISLDDGECMSLFQASKDSLLSVYHAACQQALLRCGAWWSGSGLEPPLDDQDFGLVALYLYLVSIRPKTDPHSHSCMLAIAMRIAKRRGIHNESALTKCAPLEAEMRRRLWWALASLDHRTAEMSEYTTTSLVPSWDCRVLSNLNDFELRPDMKHPSGSHNDHPTEAVFAFVRSQLCDRLRACKFHLAFVDPSLGKAGADNEADGLAQSVSKHLSLCDEADPLHFMTLLTTRAAFERLRLYEYYAKNATTQPSDSQRMAAVVAATRSIQHDTALRTSPAAKSYIWYTEFFFPAFGYVHLLKELPRRPLQEHSSEAWTAMNQNYELVEARQAQVIGNERGGLYRFYLTFGRAIVRAWERREAALQGFMHPPEPTPYMVTEIRRNALMEPGSSGVSSGETPPSVDQAMPATPTEYIDLGVPEVSLHMGPSRERDILDVDMDKFWSEIDWRWMQAGGLYDDSNTPLDGETGSAL